MAHVPARLAVEVQTGPTGVTVHVAGDLDVSTAKRLLERIPEIFADGAGHELVLDTAELDFCDSVGVSALVHIREQCERHRWSLRVTNVQPYLRRVLGLTGLVDYLNAG